MVTNLRPWLLRVFGYLPLKFEAQVNLSVTLKPLLLSNVMQCSWNVHDFYPVHFLFSQGNCGSGGHLTSPGLSIPWSVSPVTRKQKKTPSPQTKEDLVGPPKESSTPTKD